MQFDVETLHGLTSVHSLKSVEQGKKHCKLRSCGGELCRLTFIIYIVVEDGKQISIVKEISTLVYLMFS